MSSLLLNNHSPIDQMKIEAGDKSFPIWLIANPKYPDDISNIWNPIMYEIQDKVYRKLRARINSRNIFILSAFSNIGKICNTSIEEELTKKILILKESVYRYQPKLLITFGAITNEYIKRAFDQGSEGQTKYWNTGNLSNEFEQAIANFDINRPNCIPLVRRISKTANTKDWIDQDNYYYDVATKIAERIIENKDRLEIWI